MNFLEKIPLEQLPQLKDLYKADWPESIVGFHTLDNYIKWFSKSPSESEHVRVFSYNGTWNENGTFIIIVRFNSSRLNYFFMRFKFRIRTARC